MYTCTPAAARRGSRSPQSSVINSLAVTTRSARMRRVASTIPTFLAGKDRLRPESITRSGPRISYLTANLGLCVRMRESLQDGRLPLTRGMLPHSCGFPRYASAYEFLT